MSQIKHRQQGSDLRKLLWILILVVLVLKFCLCSNNFEPSPVWSNRSIIYGGNSSTYSSSSRTPVVHYKTPSPPGRPKRIHFPVSNSFSSSTNVRNGGNVHIVEMSKSMPAPVTTTTTTAIRQSSSQDHGHKGSTQNLHSHLVPPPSHHHQQQQQGQGNRYHGPNVVSMNHNNGYQSNGHVQMHMNNPYSYLTPPMHKYKQESYGVPHEMHYEEPEEEKELVDIEDKVFTKTIVGTKALKIGKIIFVFFMVLVVLVLAGLSTLGANLTPIVLPWALLPIGLIALALFVPLLIIFVPFVVAGLAGKKRRRRMIDLSITQEYFNDLEERLDKILHRWPEILKSFRVNK